MHSTNYIVRFVLIMTSIVAIILAFLSFGLKGIHQTNEAIYNKKAILSAVADHLGTDFGALGDEDVQAIFDSKVEQMVLDVNGNEVSSSEVIAKGYPGGRAEDIDMKKEKKKADADRIFPVFVYTADSGKKFHILSVRGNGLWDEIWGCIALEEDKNTIAGVAFDHQGETPGLGAEIKDNLEWKAQFTGEKIYDKSGNYTSIAVVKGGSDPDNPHAVDGITGATITADGVAAMLDSGLKYYETYLEK